MNKDPKQILKPLVRSEYFDSLVSVLQDRRDTALLKLTKCDPKDLGNLQGQVQELDYLLNLKESLTAEVKSK